MDIVTALRDRQIDVTADVMRCAVVVGDQGIGRAADVLSAIVVIVRRHRQKRARWRRSYPRGVAKPIGRPLIIVDALALLLDDVRHLVILAPGRRHKPKLIASAGVQDDRCEPRKARGDVVQHRNVDALEAFVGAPARAAREIGEPLAVAVIAKACIEIGQRRAADRCGDVAESIAFESAPRNDIEHAVGTIAVVG